MCSGTHYRQCCAVSAVYDSPVQCYTVVIPEVQVRKLTHSDYMTLKWHLVNPLIMVLS
jgi:hypothetical protein